MRDSTSGSSSTSARTRSRSAATCWPAASWRRWSSATRCCASCQAPSATRSPRPRSPSARLWRARRSTRTTRAPPSGAAGVFRTCCCPAITSGSGSGAASRAKPERTALRYDRRPLREVRPASRFFLAMSTVIDSLERTQLRRVPQFASGDRVRVHFQVIEGTRRRTQVFEGVVIKRQGEGVRETFTVRKQSFGVGVERTFPVHSPKIEKIEVAARGDVRRAKLYYLRERVGKRARVRERRYTGPEQSVPPGLVHDPVAALEAEAAAGSGAVDAEGATAEQVVDAGGAADTTQAEDQVAEVEAAEAATTGEAEPAAGAPAEAEADGPEAADGEPAAEGGSAVAAEAEADGGEPAAAAEPAADDKA